jgi:6-phosphogluconolactonase/glucosamine-6-phosphate isomerase/deaminase
MEVVIRQHEQQCGVTAADIIADAVACGATTLGLATGSSPLSVYRELIRRHRKGGLTFADVQAFLLDEYVGLPPGHPQSYAHLTCSSDWKSGESRRLRRCWVASCFIVHRRNGLRSYVVSTSV